MKNKIFVYEEHGGVLYLNDGAFTITFFPQQVSFIEGDDSYTMKIRPSLVETEIDKEDFSRLKKYSTEPTEQWLYENARIALSAFASVDDDTPEKEIQWKKLRKEINLIFKQKRIETPGNSILKACT